MGNQRTDRLGTERIGRLLIEYALPAIAAMVASSLYNIIDRIFIGNGVGPMAISGLALVMPLMSLTAAFGAMVGSGASTMVSIRLGQKRDESAMDIVGNTLVLNCLIGLLVTVFGLIYIDDILILFGASKDTLPYARDFMQVILIANLFNHNFLGFNSILRSAGFPMKAMWASLFTVGVNLVLAPLFIFYFKWGIRGAAIATACAQISGFLVVMIHFFNPKHQLHIRWKSCRLQGRIIGDILSIGMSPFLMNLCTSFVVIFLNRSLVKYGGEQGDLAVGAYGITYSIVMFFLMTVMGLNMGMQPIVGYNFGAYKNDRMLRTYKLTILMASVVTFIGFAIGELFPRSIAAAFTNDPQMQALTQVCMRILLISFPIVGFQMVTTTFFQSIGKAGWSIFLSLSRQLIFLLPGLYIIPQYFGLYGVWYANPVADILASVLTLVVILLKIKKYRQPVVR